MKSFKKIIATAALCFSGLVSAESFNLNTTSSEPLYQSLLTKEVYAASHQDHLQDLTIINASGEQVPYALLHYYDLHPQTATSIKRQPLSVFPVQESSLNNPNALTIQLENSAESSNVSLNLNNATADAKTVFLVDAGKKHPPLQTLSFDWQGSEGVLLSLEVLASDDLKNWSSVGHGVLLKTTAEGNAILQNSITLDYPTEARYLQVRSTKNEALQLSRVDAAYNNVRALTPAIMWQTVQFVQREQDNKNGVVNLDFEALGRYPASFVQVKLPQDNTITSASIFVRNKQDAPWQYITTTSLYQMNQANKTYTNPDILINSTTARFWRLAFNQANGGIGQQNPQLNLGWLPQTVVWNARGQAPFKLEVGEKPSVVNTVSVANLIPDFQIEKVHQLPVANISAPVASAVAPQPKNTWTAAPDYKSWMLWGGLLLGVMLLAGMAVSLLKSDNKP